MNFSRNRPSAAGAIPAAPGTTQTPTTTETTKTTEKPGRFGARISAIVVALALAFTFAIVPAEVSSISGSSIGATADASTTVCGWPRCTLYLNRNETGKFALSPWIPAPPANLAAALWTLVSGVHKAIALNYYNRGYCVAFQLSAVPWETQGMFAYRC
jgi:hypothetical protein